MAMEIHEDPSNYIDKGTSVEEIHFEKNGVTSIVKVYFDENGIITGISTSSQYTPSPEEENLNRLKLLKRELQEAVEHEDYKKASNIKAQIDSLTNQH